MAKKGFSVAELLAVVGCLGLLAGILLPSVSAARDLAKRAACVSQMHQIGVALATYAGVHRFSMPPFQFCPEDDRGNLPASGHWGGVAQFDPVRMANPHPVNLYCAAAEHMVAFSALICPAAPAAVRQGQESLFAHSDQFSTYCLRFPPSAGLFDESPSLAYFHGGGLLGVYQQYAGGKGVSVPGRSFSRATVPLVKLNRRYVLEPDVCFSRTTFDPATDAILSDEFWWQDRQEPAPPGTGAYAVRAGWGHGRQFNVLSGGGGVCMIDDDGTVAANSVPPGGTLVDSGVHFGKYAERVWQYFDTAR
jgi:type II secretory pathway pseudopilin PulG